MPVRIAPESSPPVPQTIAADPDGRRRWRRISSSESHTQYETRGCQSADDVNILTDSMALGRSVEPRNERTLPVPVRCGRGLCNPHGIKEDGRARMAKQEHDPAGQIR